MTPDPPIIAYIELAFFVILGLAVFAGGIVCLWTESK